MEENILAKILYLKVQSNNKEKPISTPYSIKNFLNNHQLPQGLSVRAGNRIEEWINDLVSVFNDWEDIDETEFCGSRQKDFIKINHKQKQVLYFEIKTNLSLDSEKTKSNTSKILNIKSDLDFYLEAKGINGYKIIYGILCPTNIYDSIPPKNGINLYSLKQFLMLFTDITDIQLNLIVADFKTKLAASLEYN